MEYNGLYWSDIYVFSTSRKPGITASYPVFKENRLLGVIGADIELTKISEFLKNIEIGESGIIYIFNDKEELIGFRDMKKIMIREKDLFRPAKISETFDSWHLKSYEVYKSLNNNKKRTVKTKFDFKLENKKYLARVIDFPKDFGKKWKIAIVVPEDDFFGVIKKINYFTLAISFTILLFSLGLAIIVSKNISKPVEQLTEETNKIKGFNLEGEINIHSRIVEVQNMVEAVNLMKKGLLSFEKYIPSELVKKLIANGKEAKIGGENKQLTLLFSDINDFTAITEENAVEILMEDLSEYFNIIASVIINNQGTIDKYIGDSVMSFWNAPQEDMNHTENACKAALACRNKIKVLNSKWQNNNKTPFSNQICIAYRLYCSWKRGKF